MTTNGERQAKPRGVLGNTNPVRHFGRSKKNYTLRLASLRKRYGGIYSDILRLRRKTEEWIDEKRGEGGLTLVDEAQVNACCRFELTARLAEKLIADGKSKDIVGDMKTACWATQQRNAILKALADEFGHMPGGGEIVDPWAAVDEAAKDARLPENEGDGPEDE